MALKTPLSRRAIRSTYTIQIMDFIRGLGPASPRFIADYYDEDAKDYYTRCGRLAREGKLSRWVFDGWTLYGLPEDSPPPEDLTAHVQRRQHGPRGSRCSS